MSFLSHPKLTGRNKEEGSTCDDLIRPWRQIRLGTTCSARDSAGSGGKLLDLSMGGSHPNWSNLIQLGVGEIQLRAR